MARIVNQAELAEVFGVHQSTIKLWQAEGLPIAVKGKRGASNAYDTAKVIQWYAARESGKPDETPKDRLARVQSERIEMQMAEDRGELVRADSIASTWQTLIIAARQALLNLPSRIMPLLPHALRDLIRAALDREIEAVLRKLSEQDDGAGEVAPGGDSEVGAASTDVAVGVGGTALPASRGNGHAGGVSV